MDLEFWIEDDGLQRPSFCIWRVVGSMPMDSEIPAPPLPSMSSAEKKRLDLGKLKRKRVLRFERFFLRDGIPNLVASPSVDLVFQSTFLVTRSPQLWTPWFISFLLYPDIQPKKIETDKNVRRQLVFNYRRCGGCAANRPTQSVPTYYVPTSRR